jgi:peptidoglycan/LPS O-acetylase OafA/YrhL
MISYNIIVARLRGVCILAVLILHYGGWYPSIFGFIGHASNNGYYGVTVLFVVSGFLITSHILRRYGEPSRVAVNEFYIMRFARIFPMLALTLVLLSVLAFCRVKYFSVGNVTDYLQIIGYVLTFRYNLYIVGPPPWTVLWSLSIEEAFYLIFQLLLIATQTRKSLAAVLGAVVVFGPIYRAASPSEWTSLYAYYGCFDAIALGALTTLAADTFAEKILRPAALVLLLTGCGLLAAFYFGTIATTNYVVGPMFVGMGAALVLLASRTTALKAIRPGFLDPLAFLGRFSYEIYLLHLTIFCLLRPWLFETVTQPVALFAIVFATVLVLASAIGVLYSEPARTT